MTKPNNGGPAFPRDASTAFSHGLAMVAQDGMTLRDYFAAHAPPMLDQWYSDSRAEGVHWADADAAWRYFHADRMLAWRAKEEA